MTKFKDHMMGFGIQPETLLETIEAEATACLERVNPCLCIRMERVDGVLMIPDGDGALDIPLSEWYKNYCEQEATTS